MSGFSECLTQIKEKRNLNNVEFAEICNLEKTMVFQWMSGKYIPDTWEKLSGVLGGLGLTNYEYECLKEAYEREKLGDNTYEGIQKMISIMHTLEEKANIDERGIIPLCYKLTEDNTYIETMELNNYMDVLQCVQNILAAACFCSGEKKLCLKADSISEQFLVLLDLFCNSIDGEVEMLVNIEKAENALQNLNLLKNSIDLLLSEKQISIYNGTFHNKEQVIENWLLSDDSALLFSEDMSWGLYSRDAEYIEFLKEKYIAIKGGCKKIFNKSVNLMEDIHRFQGKDITLYCVEYVPCISSGLTEEILDRYIYDAILEKKHIISELVNTFAYSDSLHAIYNVFNGKGLYRFLESGKFDNFPHDIYDTIAFEDRCKIVRNALSGETSNIEMHYFRIRDDAFLNMEKVYVEYQKGNVNSLRFQIYRNRSIEQQIEVENDYIFEIYEKFFDYLIKSGYIYSEEETRKWILQVVEEQEWEKEKNNLEKE